MTNIFSEGADYYSGATLAALKWSNLGTGNSFGVSGSARNGSGGISLNGVATKQVVASDENATFTIGVAKRRASSSAMSIAFLSDSVLTTHVTVLVTTTGEIKVFRGTSSGTQLGSTISAGTIPSGVWKYLEAKATLHDSTGVIEIRVDGVTTPLLSLTGQDTKNGGTKTVFDGFSFGGTGDIDDIYVNNASGSNNTGFLGDIKVVAGLPNADGTTSGLTGSDGNSVNNYQQADENPANTTDYNGSATNDLYDTYNYPDFFSGTGNVFAARVYDYSAKSDAGAKQAAVVVRASGTDFEQATHSLATGYQYYETLLEVNPATGVAWSVSGINGAEFGFKVKA